MRKFIFFVRVRACVEDTPSGALIRTLFLSPRGECLVEARGVIVGDDNLKKDTKITPSVTS